MFRFRITDHWRGILRFMFRAGEKLLLVLGVSALCTVAVLTLQTRHFEAREKQILARKILRHDPEAASAATPSPGALLGEIQIPRVGISAVILEGAGSDTLRLGVGHIPGTSLPGAAGNLALAGHRDTFFRPLRKIRAGDIIQIITPATTYEYAVVRTMIVAPSDTSVLAPADASTLTLVTCYPFHYVGSAPNRFVVRARAVRNHPSFTTPGTPNPAAKSGELFSGNSG